MTKKGFTLIELLVVIAIIGILSSVVLASLNTARDKGKDASAKGSLSSLRAEAEIYYDDNSGYGAGTQNTCTAGMFGASGITDLIAAADAQNGASKAVVCGSTVSAYAVSAELNSSTSSNRKYFCVDSSGFAGERTTALTAGATVCPAS